MDAEEQIARLRLVRTLQELKKWVRFELRQYLPHAVFLGTSGKLYGVGSVPTHRIEVDFPLGMLEELKNNAGALNDPLISSWLKSGKPRFVNLQNGAYREGHKAWCAVLQGFGIKNLLVHGVLNHKSRRFAAVQIGNVFGGASPEALNLLGDIMVELSETIWRVFDLQSLGDSRHAIGHPTLSLTAAELHIVELLAQGLSNKEIARLRGVSDSTVKTQVQRTGAKLGATRRAEIVAIAMPMLSPLPPQSLVNYEDDDMC